MAQHMFVRQRQRQSVCLRSKACRHSSQPVQPVQLCWRASPPNTTLCVEVVRGGPCHQAVVYVTQGGVVHAASMTRRSSQGTGFYTYCTNRLGAQARDTGHVYIYIYVCIYTPIQSRANGCGKDKEYAAYIFYILSACN